MSDPKSNLVKYELRDSIAVLTMDDGKVNAMSLSMIKALNAALDRAVADRAIVVLTGRPGVFSAGFDLSVLKAGGFASRDMVAAGFELATRIFAFPAPVIVACSGHAIAMGVFTVLAADYRIGAAGPFRIGANEVAIGLTMPHFAIEICRQRLQPAYFNRAVLNAEFFSPEQAAVAGFLDQVAPADQLLHVAASTAKQLAGLDLPSHAATKLRIREQTLQAIRRAIDADAASLNSR